MKKKWIYSRPVCVLNGYLKRLNDWRDVREDVKLTGMALGKYVPSAHRADLGATGSESTPYRALEMMLHDESFSDTDVFADIGCGKGRVLAYMAAKNKFPGKIRGVELNPDVAKIAATWAAQFPNVEIISGNAFEQDLSDITVMYLGRPFETAFFKTFVDKLETEIKHPLTVYYWVDQQSSRYLLDRPGWIREKRLHVFYDRGLPLVTNPQGFSKWTYTPAK